MCSEMLCDALVELAWSLCTELGVPGVSRNHRRVAIDPEPLIVTLPSLFEFDPRLRDQVYGWCACHASHLSLSRLRGLSKRLPETARVEFQGLAATLREHTNVRWPNGNAAAWHRAPEVKTRRLPVDRQALLRFRVRALCGTGARADVLSELLARSNRWTRASDVERLGYSKRAVAGILAEFGEAGMAKQLADGNALTFQLRRADSLRMLLDADNLAHPDWARLTSLVLAALDLTRLERAGPTTRRIEANKRRPSFEALSHELSLAPPPVTRGNPEAWEALLAWATKVAKSLAAGDSPAFGGP